MRPRGMAQVLRCVVVMLVAAGCARGGADTTASFASGAGVLGCAERALWGHVQLAQPADGRLKVTVEVDDWVIPENGGPRITFVADDPGQQVGAPSWRVTGRVLVVVSPASPPSYSAGEEARRLVQDWTAAGYPRRPMQECKTA